MKLTTKSKQPIYQALPEVYLRSGEFLLAPISPQGKTHQELASWWAGQSDAYLLAALSPDNIELDAKCINRMAKAVGFKVEKEDELYDQQMELMFYITADVTPEEYQRHVLDPTRAAKQNGSVPKPGEPTLRELWEEGERLSKPVLYLKALRKPAQQNRRTAIWTYTEKRSGDSRSWATIDLRHHPDESLRVEASSKLTRSGRLIDLKPHY